VLVLQGTCNVATKLSNGGKFFILVMSQPFLSDSDTERIVKIDQHLPKLQVKIKVAQFFGLTVYIGAHMKVGCSSFRRMFICGSVVYKLINMCNEPSWMCKVDRNLCNFTHHNTSSLATAEKLDTL